MSINTEGLVELVRLNRTELKASSDQHDVDKTKLDKEYRAWSFVGKALVNYFEIEIETTAKDKDKDETIDRLSVLLGKLIADGTVMAYDAGMIKTISVYLGRLTFICPVKNGDDEQRIIHVCKNLALDILRVQDDDWKQSGVVWNEVGVALHYHK